MEKLAVALTMFLALSLAMNLGLWLDFLNFRSLTRVFVNKFVVDREIARRWRDLNNAFEGQIQTQASLRGEDPEVRERALKKATACVQTYKGLYHEACKTASAHGYVVPTNHKEAKTLAERMNS